MSFDSQERLDWLKDRQSGIGASEMPAVMGIDPYKTALDVYLSKVQPIGPAQHDATDYRRIGLLIEPVIAKLFADKMGVTLKKAPPISWHPAISWMFASLDYQIELDDGKVEPVDCKNTSKSGEWGEEETDSVPVHIGVQMQQQMEVVDASKSHLAVLMWGNQFSNYVVHRDDELIALMMEAGDAFWQMVEKRTPPEPDWTHPACAKAVSRLYQSVEHRTVHLDDKILSVMKDFLKRKEDIKNAVEFNEALEARLKAAMGTADLAEFSDGSKMTRKLIERKEVVIPSSTYVMWRAYGPKKPKASKKPGRRHVVDAPDLVTPDADKQQVLEMLDEMIESAKPEPPKEDLV